MKLRAVLVALLCSGLVSTAFAAAPKEEEGGVPKVEYISIQPAFIANFGTASPTGKLSYVKTEMALRTTGASAKTAVEYHMPYIRNELVLLLSKQNDTSVMSNEGKEQLRQEALARVQAVLQQEEGQPLVEDLLLSTFVVQR